METSLDNCIPHLAEYSQREKYILRECILDSGHRENTVSMSLQSAYTARETVESMLSVVAVELVCATRALDFAQDCSPGRVLQAAYRTIREQVLCLDEDRPVYDDVTIVTEQVSPDVLLDTAETVIDTIRRTQMCYATFKSD